jgi:hypothetical protein
VRLSDVTLSERSAALCRQFGISENDAKAARANAGATWDSREYKFAIGQLADGRSLRFSCRFDRPEQVVTFRPVS